MGVVRREGQWRLEKQEDGFYEVTYNEKPKAKVFTPDYTEGMVNDAALAAVPVYEVGSYAEAEGVFEEHANGGHQSGMASFGGSPQSAIGFGGGDNSSTDIGTGLRDRKNPDNRSDDVFDDVEDLPPGGIALVLLLAGGFTLSTSGFAPGEPVFIVGALLATAGIALVAWAAFLFHTEGLEQAIEFLVSTKERETSTTEAASERSDEPKRTPPAPENLKNELIFDRAEQECEWCGTYLDNPEVHHIKPRNEGGPNNRSNLIVLCPTCHRKADSGGISRTKLRGKLRHLSSE